MFLRIAHAAREVAGTLRRIAVILVRQAFGVVGVAQAVHATVLLADEASSEIKRGSASVTSNQYSPLVGVRLVS
jgi:hypothetical protein